MKFYEFEHDFFPHILIPLLGGLFVIAALHSAARAETSAPAALGHNSFIISADDGYGVKDCIRGGDDCAKIVADAWCEAHGHGAARAFGRAGDITATIEKSAVTSSPSRRIKEDDVFISCGE